MHRRTFLNLRAHPLSAVSSRRSPVSACPKPSIPNHDPRPDPPQPSPAREFYELRQYQPHQRPADRAQPSTSWPTPLSPSLNRLGRSPPCVAPMPPRASAPRPHHLSISVHSTRHASAEALYHASHHQCHTRFQDRTVAPLRPPARLRLLLERNPATAPASRAYLESALLAAFEGWPKLHPARTPGKPASSSSAPTKAPSLRRPAPAKSKCSTTASSTSLPGPASTRSSTATPSSSSRLERPFLRPTCSASPTRLHSMHCLGPLSHSHTRPAQSALAAAHPRLRLLSRSSSNIDQPHSRPRSACLARSNQTNCPSVGCHRHRDPLLALTFCCPSPKGICGCLCLLVVIRRRESAK